MQFAQPIFLWALTGLSIPIAIHLLSRKDGKVIRMGSLRHLRETSTRQFRGIKLNELVLLILRCILITLFAFLVSGLHWEDNENRQWLLVENGVEKNATAQRLIDSLQARGYERHLLSEGFPKEKETTTQKHSNLWHLVSSLQAQKFEQAIVLSFSRVEYFKGMRESIPSTVQWITFPSPPANFIADAIQQDEGLVLVRNGHSESDYTAFETNIALNTLPDSIAVRKMDSLAIEIVSDVEFQNDKTIIKAALEAIAKKLPVKLTVTESRVDNAAKYSSRFLIWLSKTKPISDDSLKTIFYEEQATGQFLEQIAKSTWILTKRLTVETALKENLTLQLASLLINENEKWKQVSFQDKRQLPDSILFDRSKPNVKKSLQGQTPPINIVILSLFLMALAVERFVAYQRNQ